MGYEKFLEISAFPWSVDGINVWFNNTAAAFPINAISREIADGIPPFPKNVSAFTPTTGWSTILKHLSLNF